MVSNEKCSVLPNSLLAPFAANGYADTYHTELSGHISMEDYIYGFYTTPLFKLERLILSWTVSKPSNDEQTHELAKSKTDKFATWTMEGRTENELLMCDMIGRTRSWLMVNHLGTVDNPKTQLYFGTGVVSKSKRKVGNASFGLFFIALLPFHKAYSRFLLFFARRQLSQSITKLRD